MTTAWNAFRRFADAAEFGAPDTRRTTVIVVGGLVFVIVVPSYVLLSWHFARQPLPAYALCGWAWIAALAGLAFARRGRLRVSAQLLVAALWTTVAGLVLRYGVQSPHFGAFAPVIMGASVLLSPSATLAVTLASCAVMVVSHTLQISGSFVPPPPGTPDIVAPIAQLITAGGFSAGLVYAFSSALTSLREREAELKQSELRYAGLFDHSPDGILLLTPRADILTLNPAALSMLDTGLQAALGTSFLELPFADETRSVAEELANGKRTSGEVIVYRDGRPRVLSVNATRLNDDRSQGTDARHAGVQLTLRDVTQMREQEEAQRALEARLRRSERMEAFGQLAGGVAHDFNNILTGILGHVDLMRMKLGHELEHHPMGSGLDELERAAERGAAITRQLLLFSRKGNLDTGASDVAATVRESQELFRRLLRKDVQLTLELEDAGVVPVSTSAVEQIVMNLLINAADAVKERGHVILRVRRIDASRPFVVRDGELAAGSYVCLSVEDNGVGMSTAVLPRIFEPFFTTKPLGQGTGLGLPTVLGIVKRAGGHVDVTSKLNVGTRFDVYLPRTTRVESRPQLPREPLPVGNQQTVLVCEDEETIRNLVSELLSGHGYRVHATVSPKEALEIGRNLGTGLDLLLTDVIMPELTGPQLASELKKSMPHLKVLYMSGYTGGLLRELGIDESSANLLPKPFSASELVRRVAFHLKTAQEEEVVA